MTEEVTKEAVEEPVEEPVALEDTPVAEPKASRPRTRKVQIGGKQYTLPFKDAGHQRKLKNLFTVKAFDPNGNLVQLPVADQINNQVAGSDQLVGLRHYVRKGFVVLWDFDKNVGAYCPMGDCFAEWDDTYRGYCCSAHMSTMDVKENPGPFSRGATTSATWTRR